MASALHCVPPPLPGLGEPLKKELCTPPYIEPPPGLEAMAIPEPRHEDAPGLFQPTQVEFVDGTETKKDTSCDGPDQPIDWQQLIQQQKEHGDKLFALVHEELKEARDRHARLEEEQIKLVKQVEKMTTAMDYISRCMWFGMGPGSLCMPGMPTFPSGGANLPGIPPPVREDCIQAKHDPMSTLCPSFEDCGGLFPPSSPQPPSAPQQCLPQSPVVASAPWFTQPAPFSPAPAPVPEPHSPRRTPVSLGDTFGLPVTPKATITEAPQRLTPMRSPAADELRKKAAMSPGIFGVSPKPKTPRELGSRASWSLLSSPTPAKSPANSFTIFEDGGSTFSFTLRRADGVELGAEFTHVNGNALYVSSVVAGGALEAWNLQCAGGPSAGKVVQTGDAIVNVNGVCQAMAMLEECKTKHLLRLTIVRGEGMGFELGFGSSVGKFEN